MSDGLTIAHNPEARPTEQDTEGQGDKGDAGKSLDQFWKEFSLSPVPVEHEILARPLWLCLVAIGPLLLLVFFSLLMALMAGNKPVTRAAFSDLSDSVFVYITLSLFFGAVIYSLIWYPNISKTFQSLLANKVIYADKEKPVSDPDFFDFLESYRQALHSRKRYIYPITFTLLLTLSTVLITLGRGSWPPLGAGPLQLVELLHFMTRWVLAPAAWGFVGGLGLRVVVITARTINDLTPHFQINVLPLHSDKAGGLKKIGDLCSQVGLLVLVIAIPAVFLSVQKTSNAIGTYNCGAEIRQFISDDSIPMTEERFAQCVYYSQGGAFSGLNVLDISEEIGRTVGAGTPLKSLASDYYSANERYFQRGYLLSAYDIYYAIDFFILVILVFAVLIVIRPMWDIHYDMLNFKQKHEHEANERISSLYSKMTKAIEEDDVEEASKLKSSIKFYTDELTEIQKYPTWPLSRLPVLRAYLTSSLLSTLVTYLISVLNLTISPEAKDVISKLINP
jgi:hypothetical protein